MSYTIYWINPYDLTHSQSDPEPDASVNSTRGIRAIATAGWGATWVVENVEMDIRLWRGISAPVAKASPPNIRTNFRSI